MKVPIGAHRHVGTIDDDLIEALGYFSEEVTTPLVTPSKHDDTVNSMLHSLEIEELFSLDEPKNVSEGSHFAAQGQGQTSYKKTDGRMRPYSTCKRRHRRRPKHELDYLRAKVVELQEELAKCEKENAPNAVEELRLAPIEPATSWKEIAQHQQHQMALSIDENRKLRNRLLGQLQVARAFEAAIQQHQHEAALLCYDQLTDTGMCKVSRSLQMTDEQIFAQLNSKLELQFEEVDSVFTTRGLSPMLHELQGGFHFKREANGMSFRHEETRLLPFPLQQVHDAIWNSLHNGLVVKDTTAQLLDHDRSNLIFRDTIDLSKSHRISITKRSAFRRHVEKDNVVFVWSSYVQIDGSMSVRLLEKGWSTSSTVDFHKSAMLGSKNLRNFVRGCITRMAIQLVPEVSEFQSEQEAQLHVGKVTDLIIGTYHHNLGLVHEVADRLLKSTA